ncbi:MFS general substrate transporter [Aspergillus japonicus CBS 114.51]|uniref:MFS general substrate transporter n=2 Tax=Aspergillus TaxID=5052 RepID=A0A2V5HLP1_ASPV1|nr:MFS general substrate transporter [Aspergillus japonicus CBS 114.51]PYI23482.1 MFS general substrate transporter [Aspergillus violaceofuscus CBS 115571]RAH84311.1 MFS general substrate transporter [Aspergillus japonicus CBS 114.51]
MLQTLSDLPIIYVLQSLRHRRDKQDHDPSSASVTKPNGSHIEGRSASHDWETHNANPQNWPFSRKVFTASVIYIYTFVVYAGSAMYMSAVPVLVKQMGMSEQRALLGLSAYVLGYGAGPLLWGPMSEIPSIGRSVVYFSSFMVFIVITVGAASVDSFSTFVFLRSIQGFFGSPCLANGAASMYDMFDETQYPYALGLWTAAAYCGPALGPLLTDHLVHQLSWHWSIWLIACMSAPVGVLLFVLPETYAPTVRLRRGLAATGPPDVSAWARLKFYLVKPVQITLQDPAVFFVNLYTSFIYSSYYIFFDAFPVAYLEGYGVSTGTLALFYLSVLVGCLVAAAVYFLILVPYIFCGRASTPDHEAEPDHANPTPHRNDNTHTNNNTSNNNKNQERNLLPALPATLFLPLGLLLFGWTARPAIHWLPSLTGVVLYTGGVFVIFQSLFLYLPQLYPRYAASLFAANDFCRSALAAASIHYGVPLYRNLGVGRGSSVLGGVSVLGVVGMVGMVVLGRRVRAGMGRWRDRETL